VYPQANSYLALLDRVVLDRQLSRHEEEEIISVAQMMGLSREEAIGLHRMYLAALGRLALGDGAVTAAERQDLVAVAALLGLSEQDVDESLSSPAEQTSGCELGGFRLRPGNVVVFTGEAPGIDRADLEYQARSLGLRVASSVSGKTTLLVAADPDSISGKARKARELGIPIVDYGTYVGMLQSIAS
jgi:DNA polymerase-3 subunit epsilon